MSQIIGLTGKAGVGKDTVADYLMGSHNFFKFSFADPIKERSKYLGAPLPKTRGEKEGLHPILGVPWRKIWQVDGTEHMRQLIHPDAWILVLEARVRYFLENIGPVDVVIPDVRFENEAKWIREQGGTIWHIFREVPGVREHSSENGIEFDVHRDLMLDNNGTIDALQGNIEWLLND